VSAPEPKRLAVIHLERPRGNAINYDFLEVAGAAIRGAESPDVGAVVITGKGRAFCTGLDLAESLDYDRDELGRFVDAFEAFFERVFRLDKPVVAAINGHAVAGGCILAMAADVRVMADGEFTIGINEVEVGIPFPAVAFEIARLAVRPEAYADCFLEGRRLTPAEALRLGIVHECAPPDELLSAATARARRLAAHPLEAFATIKRELRGPSVDRIRETRGARRSAFLDAWLSAEGRASRQGILARLKR